MDIRNNDNSLSGGNRDFIIFTIAIIKKSNNSQRKRTSEGHQTERQGQGHTE